MDQNTYKNMSKPTVLSNRTIWTDCDDTLVMWNTPKNYPKDKVGRVVKVQHPDKTNKMIKLIANETMIETLKLHKRCGFDIVVWSRGGSEWAYNVCKALKILDIVDVITFKPEIVYDDQSAANWMPESKWKPPISKNGGWVKQLTLCGSEYCFLPNEHRYWSADKESREHFEKTGQLLPKKR